ncbi:hypothetical protein [Spirilliplanes yamanashiensis]|uniref:Uncharacterized protein n=1 Tax=Spirilliplanes yamanashiensis TaxID=42233 RepID=A0A8J4DJP8_9ACTN|nr:hypothetical protein [Spirilliplanes yamanashiensis]MDP9816806.1 hypothetical protein [Spirilliplanes yamanashiensis]GIJ03539.1 hypothetical protein Sya03_28910 [Spirilliplanes yamanashiensis]
MLTTDARTLLDLHHDRAAQLRAQAAADGLARAVRATGRRHARRRQRLWGALRRARLAA